MPTVYPRGTDIRTTPGTRPYLAAEDQPGRSCWSSEPQQFRRLYKRHRRGRQRQDQAPFPQVQIAGDLEDWPGEREEDHAELEEPGRHDGSQELRIGEQSQL